MSDEHPQRKSPRIAPGSTPGTTSLSTRSRESSRSESVDMEPKTVTPKKDAAATIATRAKSAQKATEASTLATRKRQLSLTGQDSPGIRISKRISAKDKDSPKTAADSTSTEVTPKASASVSGAAASGGSSRKRERSVDPDVSTPGSTPKRRRAARRHTTGDDSNNKNDFFCWVCYEEGTVICCELCPRVYHFKCLAMEKEPSGEWVCPECEQLMRAECTDTRSTAMSMISVDQLCLLLKFALQRMKCQGSEPFHKAVDTIRHTEYAEYVFHPMDLSALERNIQKRVYGSTEAFHSDAKWILHNCVVFNGKHHKLTNVAKTIVKICKHEMNEIEICPDCYFNSCTKRGGTNWFCEPCRIPHPLVFAKMRGYPFWPAKTLRTVKDQVDCRFFGEHDRAWVPVSSVFLLSREVPGGPKKSARGLEQSMAELEEHIERIRSKFGSFEYAPPHTNYNPESRYIHAIVDKSKTQLESAAAAGKCSDLDLTLVTGMESGGRLRKTGPVAAVSGGTPASPGKKARQGEKASLSVTSRTANAVRNKYSGLRAKTTGASCTATVPATEGTSEDIEDNSTNDDENQKATSSDEAESMELEKDEAPVSKEATANDENTEKTMEEEGGKEISKETSKETSKDTSKGTSKGTSKEIISEEVDINQERQIEDVTENVTDQEIMDKVDSKSEQSETNIDKPANPDNCNTAENKSPTSLQNNQDSNIVDKVNEESDGTKARNQNQNSVVPSGTVSSEIVESRDKSETNNLQEEKEGSSKTENDEKQPEVDKADEDEGVQKSDHSTIEGQEAKKQDSTAVGENKSTENEDSQTSKTLENETSDAHVTTDTTEKATALDSQALKTLDTETSHAPPPQDKSEKSATLDNKDSEKVATLDSQSSQAPNKTLDNTEKSATMDNKNAEKPATLDGTDSQAAATLDDIYSEKCTTLDCNASQGSQASGVFVLTDDALDSKSRENVLHPMKLKSGGATSVKAKKPDKAILSKIEEKVKQITEPGQNKDGGKQGESEGRDGKSGNSDEIHGKEKESKEKEENKTAKSTDDKTSATKSSNEETSRDLVSSDGQGQSLPEVSPEKNPFLAKVVESCKEKLGISPDEELEGEDKEEEVMEVSSSEDESGAEQTNSSEEDMDACSDSDQSLSSNESDTDRLVIDEAHTPSPRRSRSPKTGKIVKRASPKATTVATGGGGSGGLKLSVGQLRMLARAGKIDQWKHEIDLSSGSGLSSRKKNRPTTPKDLSKAPHVSAGPEKDKESNSPPSNASPAKVSDSSSKRSPSAKSTQQAERTKSPDVTPKNRPADKQSPKSSLSVTKNKSGGGEVTSGIKSPKTSDRTPDSNTRNERTPSSDGHSKRASKASDKCTTSRSEKTPTTVTTPTKGGSQNESAKRGRVESRAALTSGVPVPDASKVTSAVGVDCAHYTQKIMEAVERTVQEITSQLIGTQGFHSKVKTEFEKEVARLKWQHSQELAEIKHNAALQIREIRASLLEQHTKRVSELENTINSERATAEQRLAEAKKKQWCAKCGKEAIFYCCWNTSYCDYPCQQAHWPEHMTTCTQSQSSQMSADQHGGQSEASRQAGAVPAISLFPGNSATIHHTPSMQNSQPIPVSHFNPSQMSSAPMFSPGRTSPPPILLRPPSHMLLPNHRGYYPHTQ